ncbi:MAG: hypothetical protein GF398_03625 [Chitinivibrionales bacterium]|nr:hypothetical protein [Chitinivibrionales bacterium]
MRNALFADNAFINLCNSMRVMCSVIIITSIVASAAQYPVITPGDNIVAFSGAQGEDVYTDVLQLSDGTILIAGQTADLGWIPSSATKKKLPATGIDSRADGCIGFIMQLSADMEQVLSVIYFPEGTLQDIRRMRTTNIPGEATGGLYISGTRINATGVNNRGQTLNGYVIARLNNNFVNGVPDDLDWSYDAECPARRAGGTMNGLSSYGEIQPWDVGNDGSVVFGRGAEFDFDWAIIEKLDAQGSLTTVTHWRTHWTDQPTEIATTLDIYNNSNGTPKWSGIVMKTGRGSLRSWTIDDYNLWQNDGNGGRKKGKWPNDYYFSGPKGYSSKGGYTGYRLSGKPTNRVGGIAIDRRNNHLYFGYNNQSVLPGGNPDYEPAVVAMDNEGRLKWWSRLYAEFIDKDSSGDVTSGDVTTSSPDQYVDGLAIDYSAPGGGALVVVARCHGNNVINFWNGNSIQYSANPGGSFQNRFTGTNGNIHISWIGRFTLDTEEIRHSTYVAEMNEGANTQGSLNDPLLIGWYNPNGGWPDVNTTKTEPNSVRVDGNGNVYLLGTGRRTITTSNAYMQMPKPAEGHSVWNEFARVYSRDLRTLRYSTIVAAPWDISTQAGGAHQQLSGIWPTSHGVFAVGAHAKDEDDATSMPSAHVPSWGSSEPMEQKTAAQDNWDGLFAYFAFDNQNAVHALQICSRATSIAHCASG